MPMAMLTIQDWLIAFAIFTLIVCALDMRRFKKAIIQEIQRKILPQLTLELDRKAMCLYLKNDGFSVVQDIQIEDSAITLDDSGFRVDCILQFENIGFLRPKEGTKLKLKVLGKDKSLLPEVTEKIFPHLFSISFVLAMTCKDTEGHQLKFIFSKKGDNFYSEITR